MKCLILVDEDISLLNPKSRVNWFDAILMDNPVSKIYVGFLSVPLTEAYNLTQTRYPLVVIDSLGKVKYKGYINWALQK